VVIISVGFEESAASSFRGETLKVNTGIQENVTKCDWSAMKLKVRNTN
jgi:hypothetical protein